MTYHDICRDIFILLDLTLNFADHIITLQWRDICHECV